MSIAKPALMRNPTFGWPTRAEAPAYRLKFAESANDAVDIHVIARCGWVSHSSGSGGGGGLSPNHLFLTLS
jgi:hypothetical protein